MTTSNDNELPPDIAAPSEPPPPPAAPSEHAKVVCANCGTPLLGDVCYACGQPVKGLVRHLGSILHDVADTIFNIDSRIFRTLVPLYFRPGYLTNEYFAGRRVRYVTPFRLYFFLSVAAFLLMQVSIDTMDMMSHVHFDDATSVFAKAQSREDVEKMRDDALRGLEAAREATGSLKEAQKGIEKKEAAVRKQADKRIAALQRVADAKAAGKPVPNEDDDVEDNNFEIGGKVWDAEKNPIHVSWLPDFANAKLNAAAGRMKNNVASLQKNPKPVIVGAISMLPQVLFFLMPIFALMLKIFYLFKRRLYMEHLIVALHSHSFIFLSLFLLTLVALALHWAREAATWLVSPLDWLMFAMGWWIPIYLFVMQKKVYRQGWIFTFVKYSIIGIGYMVLISMGASVAFVVSMATT